ncbi:MAG: hypothetical protein CML05_03590 [Pseudozobellia sp.]|nr:hypothetical protein [Pseudozobellia sp.]|tara:strand:- start:1623 stop:2417 length:795 start_codon:yes stop_codon:yes gene_type:complete
MKNQQFFFPEIIHIAVMVLQTRRIVVLVLILSIAFTGCSQQSDENVEDVVPKNRVISFSGYDWLVRSSGVDKEGPGPNIFSDSEENVWVDGQGRLHLKIVYKEGIGYCAAVAMHKSFGYNKYVLYSSSRFDLLDANAVAGFFVYNSDVEEIDIEFSKWSVVENENAQFAIQPSSIPTNKHRFDLKMENEKATHFFDWKPQHITFGSFEGHVSDLSSKGYTWVYEGDDIPIDTEERLKINLWLFKGKPPVENKDVEIIIDRVEIL